MTAGESSASPDTQSKLDQVRASGEIIDAGIEYLTRTIHSADEFRALGFKKKEVAQDSLVAGGPMVSEKVVYLKGRAGQDQEVISIVRFASDARALDVTGITAGLHQKHAKYHSSSVEIEYRRAPNDGHAGGLRIRVENGVLASIEDLRVVKWVPMQIGIYQKLDPDRIGQGFMDNWDRLAEILKVMKLRVES